MVPDHRHRDIGSVIALEKKAIADALLHQGLSAAGTFSGVKVGASVIARKCASDGEIRYDIFSACNTEWSKRKGIHAEIMAANTAIMMGYSDILVLYVTSQSVEETACLCGTCADWLMKLNRSLPIIVLNPDGSVKMRKVLDKDVLPLAYSE